MRLLRVNLSQLSVTFEELSETWKLVGGRGLVACILNQEVPSDCAPLGEHNKLIIAGGPLAGTMAPQLGRISVGGKSPLTLGIKEANAGGPAAQKLDRLGIRAIIVEGAAAPGKFFNLEITGLGARLVPADEYRGLRNYPLAEKLYEKYPNRPAIISIGPAGERQYKAAAVSFTDVFGDPSRNAARGGLGAVMGAKGLKAVIIDDSGAPPVAIADKALFQKTVASWVETLRGDVSCGLFTAMGTPHAVSLTGYMGTMPGANYITGRPTDFLKVSGEEVKKRVWERGGKMHGCMPGCVIQCSIVYPDAVGKRLASAYEYEAISMLGTNLGIYDLDDIARLKFICDDLGLDLIEVGASLAVAASTGKMKMGGFPSAVSLLEEIERGTEFGAILADGVVATARALNVHRVPAFKGQAIPAHDPRAAKGIGVTYATSSMGADHTAGITYRTPLLKTGQVANSMRFQLQAVVCDTMGYCLNAVPGGQASVYAFLADLLHARYGLAVTADDIVEVGKQTLKDELKFNEGTEFRRYERYPSFVRSEPLPPTNGVFDVDDAELDGFWDKLDGFRQPGRVWEVRFPTLPQILFGTGVIQRLGEQARNLGVKKALLIADPSMGRLGRVDEVCGILENSRIASAVFTDLEADPPVEEIEKIAAVYREQGCDGLIALGGGSSIDAAKAAAVRVSQPGILTEYDSTVGGTSKIKSPVPPIICIPTTSGTGSEVNQYAVITDRQRPIKFVIVSNLIVPKLAVVDPNLCRTMPPQLTAETGIDALGHCVEGYLGTGIAYHPYYESLALYGVKLVGRSLRKACSGNDMESRADMCMAAMHGGICFAKGLGLGHAIAHMLGAQYHMPHGRAVALGLLCYVRAINESESRQTELNPALKELARMLSGSDDLEAALLQLYRDVNIPARLRDAGIPESDVPRLAFETSKDVVLLSGNPVPVGQKRILELLRESY